jgi:hypothetical protein
MRRRWKLLVAVGAVALLAGLLFLLPSRDDGLDWVRKFGGKEEIPEKWYMDGSKPFVGERRVFRFKTISPELKETLKESMFALVKEDEVEITGTTEDDWQVRLSDAEKVLECYRPTHLTGMAGFWYRLKDSVGLSP